MGKPLPIKALVGGEPVQLVLAKTLLSKCDSVWNIYGPTETTVCSVLKFRIMIIQLLLEDQSNTQIYLLNKVAEYWRNCDCWCRSLFRLSKPTRAY
jgi:non-ribosomal peptide synthetase component F